MDQGLKAPRWAWWVATGLGSGRLRPASGTWGSLAALVAWVILALGLRHVPGRAAVEAILILATLALTWVSVKASDLVVRETGVKDPGFVVADEWAGMWIALWGLRWEILGTLPTPGRRLGLLLFIPFFLFRLFDVWKPWPAYQVQALPEGQGVVADDVVAGLYALAAGQVILGLFF